MTHDCGAMNACSIIHASAPVGNHATVIIANAQGSAQSCRVHLIHSLLVGHALFSWEIAPIEIACSYPRSYEALAR